MKRILFQLCLIRAKYILWKVKRQYPHSKDVMAKDPKPAPAGDYARAGSEALDLSLPGILQAIQTAVPALAKTQLQAEQETSPAYNELLASLYEKYGPRLAAAGSGIEAQQRKSTGATDVELLRGSGAEAGRTAEELNKEFNPEYYASRKTAADKLGELLGSINLGNANPEAERLISQENARTGNVAQPSQTNTISNALSFGNELQKRRNALGSALNIASGFLPTSQSNVGIGFAGGTAGRTPTGTGVNQFAGVQGGESAGQGQGITSNVFNVGAGAKGQQQQLLAQRRDVMDRINEGFSSLP